MLLKHTNTSTKPFFTGLKIRTCFNHQTSCFLTVWPFYPHYQKFNATKIARCFNLRVFCRRRATN